MRELLRPNDPVRLSWLQALLADAGIESLILDHHTSVIEGSIGAIPRFAGPFQAPRMTAQNFTLGAANLVFAT